MGQEHEHCCSIATAKLQVHWHEVGKDIAALAHLSEQDRAAFGALPAAANTSTDPSNSSAPQALPRAEAVAGTQRCKQPDQAQSAPGIWT